jgi:hypothetical protein
MPKPSQGGKGRRLNALPSQRNMQPNPSRHPHSGMAAGYEGDLMAMVCGDCQKPLVWVIGEDGTPRYPQFTCECKQSILIVFPTPKEKQTTPC